MCNMVNGFKFFHGFIDSKTIDNDAFNRLMEMLHDLDWSARTNYEDEYMLDEDESDWDVTLSDGLGEE